VTYNLKRADIVHGCMSLTDLEWERERASDYVLYWLCYS